MSTLVEVLKNKVKALGQSAAAEYFGVPQSTISLWEKGEASKQLAAVQKLMDEAAAQAIPTLVQPVPQAEPSLLVGKAYAPATPSPPVLGILVPTLPAISPATLSATSPEVPAPAGEPLTDLGAGKVTILIPVYRFITWQLQATLFRNFRAYGPEKVEIAHWPGTCVWRARNTLVERFLKSKSEWAIFCDDDVVLPCGSAQIINGIFHARLPEPLASRNAISRIMSHPADKRVVGALCYVKGDPKITGDKMSGRAMCSDAYDSDGMNAELHDPKADWGLRKQEWFVGINFCRVHRSVFEEMAAAAEGRWPEFDIKKDGSARGWFNPRNNIDGEDLAFMARCKQLGIEMWLDSSLICGHADGSMVWWHYNTI
jgi:transcriptional regulator with XRE-family HTH domain